MSGDSLEQRLEAYGDVLRTTLASQPAWSPPSGGGGPGWGPSSGSWLNRYFHIIVAVLAASAITAVAFAVAGVGGDDTASSLSAELTTTSDTPAAEASVDATGEPISLQPSGAAIGVDEGDEGDEGDGGQGDGADGEQGGDADEVLGATAVPAESATAVPPTATPLVEPSPTAGQAAEAATGELTCAIGTLVGDQCRVVGPEPGPPPVDCTEQTNDDGDCFWIEAADTSCGLGEFDGTGCVSEVAQLNRQQTCASGFSLSGDRCISTSPASQECSAGVLSGDQCVISGPAPTGGGTICPVNGSTSSSDCFELVPVDCGSLSSDPAGGCREDGDVETRHSCLSGLTYDGDNCVGSPTESCPSGYSASASGSECEKVEQVEQRRDCEPGASATRIDDDTWECRSVAPPELSCPAGSLDGNRCVDSPLVELICSLTGGSVSSPSQCYRSEPGSCGNLDPAGGGMCRKPVGMVDNPLVCSSGYTLSGGDCVKYGSPQTVCSQGNLEGNQCVSVGSGPFLEAAECPTGENSDGECVVIYAPRRECREGGELLDDGTCRFEIVADSDELVCPEDHILEDPDCVQYIPATRT